MRQDPFFSVGLLVGMLKQRLKPTTIFNATVVWRLGTHALRLPTCRGVEGLSGVREENTCWCFNKEKAVNVSNDGKLHVVCKYAKRYR